MNIFKIRKTIIFQYKGNSDLLKILRDKIDDLLTKNFGNNITIADYKIQFSSWFGFPLIGPLRFIHGGQVQLEKSITIYRLDYTINFHLNYLLWLAIALIAFFSVLVEGSEPIIFLYAFLGIIMLFFWITILNNVSFVSFTNLMMKAIKESGGKKID